MIKKVKIPVTFMMCGVVEVETEDGKVRFIEPDFDPYYSNFLRSTTYRENCYSCHYTKYNRVADITLADYWGINGIHPDFYSEKGVLRNVDGTVNMNDVFAAITAILG